MQRCVGGGSRGVGDRLPEDARGHDLTRQPLTPARREEAASMPGMPPGSSRSRRAASHGSASDRRATRSDPVKHESLHVDEFLPEYDRRRSEDHGAQLPAELLRGREYRDLVRDAVEDRRLDPA
jgi:hypothetical protein